MDFFNGALLPYYFCFCFQNFATPFCEKEILVWFVGLFGYWLLVWLCCSLFCTINMPAFPGLLVLLFLWVVLKKVKMLLFEVFRSYSWQGMGFVPASICCLELFPVGRPDPGAPSSERGWEAPEDRDLCHLCLAEGPQLSQQWHLCFLMSVWDRKIPFQWNYLIKVLGEFLVAVHSCVTITVKHHFHTYGVFMDPVDFFNLEVRLSFPSAATSGFDIMRNKVEHFFRAVYSIANIFRNFLLFGNKI